MAGFLDNKTQVMDVVLTNYGKELFSRGKLRFVYYTFSDDDVDYNPYISTSGSMSDVALSASKVSKIEDTLVREAVVGYERGVDKVGKDQTNIYRKLYTIPQGQTILPEVTMNPTVSSGTLDVKQRKIQEVYVKKLPSGAITEKLGPYDRGFEKTQKSGFDVTFTYEGFPVVTEGFMVKVFHSGSNGVAEVIAKRDFENDVSYMNDIKLFVDDDIVGSRSHVGALKRRG
jgi:hypothetical protein